MVKFKDVISLVISVIVVGAAMLVLPDGLRHLSSRNRPPTTIVVVATPLSLNPVPQNIVNDLHDNVLPDQKPIMPHVDPVKPLIPQKIVNDLHDNDVLPDRNPVVPDVPPIKPVVPPAPQPVVPQKYHLTDRWGQIWEHTDRDYLERFVAQRNQWQFIQSPAPSCSSGRCGIR